MDRKTYTQSRPSPTQTSFDRRMDVEVSSPPSSMLCEELLGPPLSREANLRHAHLLRKRVDTGGFGRVARRRVAQAAYDIVDAFAR